MRLKSKWGSTFSSTSATVFFWLPAWISLSCLTMPITSCVTFFTRTSGATSWAGASGAASVSKASSKARVMTLQS